MRVVPPFAWKSGRAVHVVLHANAICNLTIGACSVRTCQITWTSGGLKPDCKCQHLVFSGINHCLLDIQFKPLRMNFKPQIPQKKQTKKHHSCFELVGGGLYMWTTVFDGESTTLRYKSTPGLGSIDSICGIRHSCTTTDHVWHVVR